MVLLGILKSQYIVGWGSSAFLVQIRKNRKNSLERPIFHQKFVSSETPIIPCKPIKTKCLKGLKLEFGNSSKVFIATYFGRRTKSADEPRLELVIRPLLACVNYGVVFYDNEGNELLFVKNGKTVSRSK